MYCFGHPSFVLCQPYTLDSIHRSMGLRFSWAKWVLVGIVEFGGQRDQFLHKIIVPDGDGYEGCSGWQLDLFFISPLYFKRRNSFLTNQCGFCWPRDNRMAEKVWALELGLIRPMSKLHSHSFVVWVWVRLTNWIRSELQTYGTKCRDRSGIVLMFERCCLFSEVCTLGLTFKLF